MKANEVILAPKDMDLEELKELKLEKEDKIGIVEKYATETKNSKDRWSFLKNYFMGKEDDRLRTYNEIIEEASQSDSMARSVKDTGNVYMVPAFTGLSAPYWDMYARGLIIGITRGTNREHIARAALESIAYQTRDVIDAMVQDSGQEIESLRVDGGATASQFLMQFQSDILGIPVVKPVVTEMAALGAAYLAGLGVGYWKDIDELRKHWKIEKVFEPGMRDERKEELYSGWKRAVKRSLKWAKD